MSAPASAAIPASSPRRRRKEARPAELISAALDVFVEKGYAATRLEDVATLAGVSKGTLYLYYASKEALFKSVVREGLIPALTEAENLAAGFTGSTEMLLRQILGGLWRMFGSQRIGGIPKLVFAEARNFPEIARFYHDEVIRRGTALLASVIERGVARGEFRALDVAATVNIVLAPLLMRMIWRYSLDAYAAAGVDDERYFSEYFEVLLRGLRAAPADVGKV